MTLLIMAAGMGSRFGGLKQVEPVGPSGEFILDYSIYDAIKAGFDKIVFIIKEENYDLFRKTVGRRIESKIKVEYAFQKIDDIPDKVSIPETRVKPWGTSHAILSAKKYINEPFIVINADDFYGKEPFEKVADYFKNNDNESNYAMIGYKVINTMSENGAVKRGVCNSDKNDKLVSLTESSVENKDGKIIATPLDESISSFEINDDTLVSMNFWAFYPNIFNYLEKEMISFFEKNKDNLEKCEFLIPDTVFKLIKENEISVSVLNTKEKWYGITYKEDKDNLVTSINNMIKEGKYPKDLWN